MKDPYLGRTIAQRYRLISRLGAGATAEVFLARHVLIDRLNAIKVIPTGQDRDPVSRERFLREARAVNRINHPSIVEISDYGEADGLVYLVMEYVPGESVARALWGPGAGSTISAGSARGRWGGPGPWPSEPTRCRPSARRACTPSRRSRRWPSALLP